MHKVGCYNQTEIRVFSCDLAKRIVTELDGCFHIRWLLQASIADGKSYFLPVHISKYDHLTLSARGDHFVAVEVSMPSNSIQFHDSLSNTAEYCNAIEWLSK